jgi:hypothetical protein
VLTMHLMRNMERASKWRVFTSSGEIFPLVEYFPKNVFLKMFISPRLRRQERIPYLTNWIFVINVSLVSLCFPSYLTQWHECRSIYLTLEKGFYFLCVFQHPCGLRIFSKYFKGISSASRKIYSLHPEEVEGNSKRYEDT